MKTFFLALLLLNASLAVAEEEFVDESARIVLSALDEMPNLRTPINMDIVAEVADSQTTKIKKKDKPEDSNRFTAGASEFGLQLGWGRAVNIPPNFPRTKWTFAFFFPNYKRNLTGIVGDSFFRGTLSWVTELGLVEAYKPSSGYVYGFSPLILEYKFVQPNAKIIPYVFIGAGFAYTDWNEKSFQREIATNFEFLLHLGGGVEFYKTKHGALSLNYRFFHISNAGIKFPNIGVNANVVNLGYSFF